jgi:hypothetical protein
VGFLLQTIRFNVEMQLMNDDRNAEIRFSKYGYAIHALIFASKNEWTFKLVKLGNRFRKSGQDFDQNGSKHHWGHTLKGQVKVNYIQFESPKTGEIASVEITVGHDENWNPVLTVSGSESDPVRIESKGVPEDDYPAIREQALICFDKSGVDLR